MSILIAPIGIYATVAVKPAPAWGCKFSLCLGLQKSFVVSTVELIVKAKPFWPFHSSTISGDTPPNPLQLYLCSWSIRDEPQLFLDAGCCQLRDKAGDQEQRQATSDLVHFLFFPENKHSTSLSGSVFCIIKRNTTCHLRVK